jgi:hypothetical protein
MLATAVAVCAVAGASPQDISGPTLKATFLLNFVRFTEWPASVAAPEAPFTVCVLGDARVAESLEAIVKGHPVDGHVLIARQVYADSAIRNCHLIYISDVGLKESIALVGSLNNAPALTVSDLAGFAQGGGMVSLIVEGDKIRFAVNVEATVRARLHLSSRLLTLASVVKDQSTASAR